MTDELTYENIDNNDAPAPPDDLTNVELIGELATSQVAFPEAPASVNFFGVTSKGWNVQFTLRDIDEENMMRRFAKFTQWLEQHDVTPKQVGKSTPSNASQPTSTASKHCNAHNVDMPQRTAKKTGKVFHSHFVDDENRWCYGE